MRTLTTRKKNLVNPCQGCLFYIIQGIEGFFNCYLKFKMIARRHLKKKW